MSIKEHRWIAPEGVYARRVDWTDQEIKGILGDHLMVEPGTRAFVVQDGESLGELPPGDHTIRSLKEKLQFWQSRQTTVILTRSEIVPISLAADEIPTLEGLSADVRVRIGVQIADIAMFLNNLLGPRVEFTIAELEARLKPVITQALWQSIGTRSARELRAPGVAADLNSSVADAVSLAFQRYGMKFTGIDVVIVKQAELEQVQHHINRHWLELAKESADNDRLRENLDLITRRAEIRTKLRDAVMSDKMDGIRTKEEFADFLHQVDSDKLLRQEEHDILTEEFDHRKADRGAVREHLAELTSVNRAAELDELRMRSTFAVEKRALSAEIELADLAGDKVDRQWKRELERERRDREENFASRLRAVTARWDRVRENNRRGRDDERDKLIHEQEMETLRASVELAATDRKRRVALLEQELADELNRRKVAAERHRQEFQLESADRDSERQMLRLRQVQDLNFQASERDRRLQSELDELKSDKTHQRDLERLQTMSGLGTDVLIATANTANAALLADLKKQQSADQANHAGQDKLNEERLRLYERLSEVERAKADAITQAFREASQSHQTLAQQVLIGLTGSQQAPVTMPPPLVPAVAIWHMSVGGLNQGPYTVQQLQGLLYRGQFSQQTMVWRAGWPGWLPAGQSTELASLFGGTANQSVPPPPPPPV